MKIHKIKLKEPYFSDVFKLKKTFELREDDRNYEVGDMLYMRKTPFSSKEYSVNEIQAEIIYKLDNCRYYGLERGYCILGISVKDFSHNYTED